MLKALSIRQPWAWLMVNGLKDIENRTWRTQFRGRIYVHASKRWDYEGQLWLQQNHPVVLDLELDRSSVFTGGIVGEMTIVDCVTHSLSPWFQGPSGFLVENPVAYDTPIPRNGRLVFFEPAIETTAAGE